MSTPEHSPLPWINEPDDAELGFGVVRDANGEVVQIYGSHGMELRARIVAAVNSRTGLLAAATEAAKLIDREPTTTQRISCLTQLKDAIAAAEDPAS